MSTSDQLLSKSNNQNISYEDRAWLVANLKITTVVEQVRLSDSIGWIETPETEATAFTAVAQVPF